MSEIWQNLEKADQELFSTIEVDEKMMDAISIFDYSNEGKTSFLPWKKPELPSEWNIGLIIGGSGSGKSTLLKEFGESFHPSWDSNKAIISQFENSQEATELMYAVGLSSVPTWCKPYQILSNGEKFRADLAASIFDGNVIDEFTSVVDRNVAKAASRSLSKYIKQKKIKNLVFATCHKDVIPWLEPDWIIDTDAGMYSTQPSECLRRKPLVVEIYEVKQSLWSYFHRHHYLNGNHSTFAKCFAAVINGELVAFDSVLSYPSGTVKNAFREHRLVTIPDFQGWGIGVRLSDWVANYYVSQGKRYFSKTAHPRLGEYREKSDSWKPTSKNKKKRKDPIPKGQEERFQSWILNPNRMTYSHEFIKIKGETQ